MSLKFFTLEEFKRASHPENIPPALLPNVLEVLQVVDLLREKYGKPLFILQGGAWRGTDFNNKIGGSRNSRHLTGEAIDLRGKPSNEENIKQLAAILEGLLKDGSLSQVTQSRLGIGKYLRGDEGGSFLHIDVRKGLPARWEEDKFRKITKKEDGQE